MEARRFNGRDGLPQPRRQPLLPNNRGCDALTENPARHGVMTKADATNTRGSEWNAAAADLLANSGSLLPGATLALKVGRGLVGGTTQHAPVFPEPDGSFSCRKKL
jgi:hypothetical protein